MDAIVTLRAAGRTLSASRQALQKSSAYFKAMFTCGMKESSAAEIEIKDIDPELLQILIDYSEGKKTDIAEAAVYDLLRASVVFQFHEVLEKCIDYLIQSINVGNAVSVWIAGDTFAIEQLYRAALRMILWNFDEFAKSLTCVQCCPTTLFKSLLIQNRLNVSSENVICEVLKEWLRSNVEKCSKDEALQLLSLVRYSHIDMHVIETLKSSSAGFVSEFLEVVLALLRNEEVCSGSRLAEPARRSLTLPRRMPAVVPAIVVATALSMGPLRIFIRNSAEKPFTFYSKLPTLPKPLQGYVVCSVGKDVYFLCGEYGIGSGRWNTDVMKWDPCQHRWTRIGVVPSVRRHCKTAVVGKRIFLVGGFGKFRVVLDSVEIFDTSSGHWRWGSSVPCPTFSAAVGASEDSVFLFSGQVYRYDVLKDAWVLLLPWFPSGPFTALPCGQNIVLVPETEGPLLEFDTRALTYRHLATWNRTTACACVVGDAMFCLSNEGRGTLHAFGNEGEETDVQVGVDQSGKVECCFAMPFFDFDGSEAR